MIRSATSEDAGKMAVLGAKFFIESGWAAKGFKFCPHSFCLSMEALSKVGILLVATEGGEPVGMMGAGISQAFWNYRVLTAQELFWYVDPAFRHGLGRDLLDAFEEAAKARGVRLGGMAAEEGLRSQALGRLYRQRDYFPVERLFWKDLEGGA